MANSILFVGTTYMGLYQDIISEMRSQGYNVDFIEEIDSRKDPLNVRGYKGIKKILCVNSKKYDQYIADYWKNILNSPNYNKPYDYLFVLDGKSLHKCLFDILKQRNTKLKSVNYLFDTTNGVYRFEKKFALFDKVVTFDRSESVKYDIDFLPIYWKPDNNMFSIVYKFFGLGAYKKDRYKLFEKVSQFAKRNKYPYYIRLRVYKYHLLKIKYFIRMLLGINQNYISPKEYHSEIAMHHNIPLSVFQSLLNKSEIVLDTNAPHQDGLTARFMQALGSGKKIITTNKSVVNYEFYTSEQIYVVDDIDNFTCNKSFQEFVIRNLKLNANTLQAISKMRIDNWVKYLLN